VFGPGAKIDLLNDYNCSLVLNGMILKQVSCSKYLGVFIDDELKWKTHINYVVKKLLKYVGIFYKLRSYLPLRTLKQLYYAFVHSNLIYCIEIYGNAPMSYLDPIKKLTNRILRILQNKPLSYPVKLLYSNFNTLPFSSLHKLYVAKFVHQCKFSNCNLPGIFKNYYFRNSFVHNHNTRISNDPHLCRVNNSHGQQSLKHLGVQIWQKIPKSIQMIRSVKMFLKFLKKWYINEEID
jgi:hypothetical protein